MASKKMTLLVMVTIYLTIVSNAFCQDYPKKPVQLFIPFEVGQSADISARGVAAAMEKFLKQPVVCVNKTGAGGAICFDFVRNSKPDGYNLGFMTLSALTQTNTGRLPYNYKAWDYIARINTVPTTITIKADAKWENIKELIDYAKNNPGKLKIGNAGKGSFTHLVAIAFEESANIEVAHVPTGIRRRHALLSGEVDAISVHPPEIVSLVKGGEMRILGVVFPQRMKEFPEVPNLKELGYDIKLIQSWGVFGPKGIPDHIKKYLAEVIQNAIKDKIYQELAIKSTLYIDYMALDEFEKFIKSQDEIIKSLIDKFGLKERK